MIKENLITKINEMELYLIGKYESVKSEYLYAVDMFGNDSEYTKRRKAEYSLMVTILNDNGIEYI